MSHRGLICSRLALSITVAIIISAGAWAQPAGYEDLAGPLKSLAAQAAQGTMNTAAARNLGLRVQGNRVGVTILFRSAAAAAATGLGQYGGTVEIRRDQRVQAMLPAGELASIAALPQVAQIIPTQQLILSQGFGGVSSEGVQFTNATAFHLAGINGEGVKVAVVDAGFAGVTTAEVPIDIATDIVNFRADNNINTTNHGTAVAQIIADMAPRCDMTLIAVNSPMEVQQAIDYIIAQRFQVVNMSAGFADGPFDGTHPVSQAVNRARNAGIIWVNAAGNQAQEHWQGQWMDLNSDTWLEFEGSQSAINLDLSAGTFQAFLSWFETSGGVTANDYDLVLLDGMGATVARSAITQNGDDPPQEELLAYVPAAGQYRLRVQRMSSLPVGGLNERFQLFTPNVTMEGTVQHSENSLLIPAEATGALTVGATRGISSPIPGVTDVPLDAIEPFSSRGSIGSNAKPDMVAPDGVATSLTGVNPFMGTSAAAPHVAGAIALLLSEDLGRSAQAIRTLLEQMARKYLVPGDIPDSDINAYGFGRLALRVGANTDGDAPVVRIDFPINNSTITVASPRVIATATDTGGVDPNTIQVWLDNTKIIDNGVPVAGFVSDYSYDASSGTIVFNMNNLTRTAHTLVLQAADLSGNQSPQAMSNFRITTPTIAAGLHIISLPYPGLANQDPSQIFGVPLEQLALLRWVPSDSRFSKYHIYPDEFAGFQPPDQLVERPPAGLGYFLRLPSTGTLNINASGLTDPSYNIRLVYGTDAPRGWNLIGNPYEDYVDWGGVEFISANGRQDLREAMTIGANPVTEGVLFEFVSNAGGGYYDFAPDPTQATMAPLKGYWLHVLKDATLVVHNTGATSASVRPRQAAEPAAAPTATNWNLRLQARAAQYMDPSNYVGISAAATDGYDIGVDVSEPPPLVDSLQLYMPASRGNLAKDMRSAVAGRQEWDVEVSCRLADTPIEITWPTLNSSVPRDLTLRLQDKDSGASVYMRTANGYTFQMSEPGVRHLQIVAESSSASALVLSGVNAASAPSGQVTLTYMTTREADVSVEIRNISGTLIKNLGQRAATPGTAQTVMWNGRNESGARVPAGRYLARVTARAADGQSVQAIRPFNVSR